MVYCITSVNKLSTSVAKFIERCAFLPHQLFHSDHEFASGLPALMENEYPFTSLENRLKVLTLLTDALLTTNAIRDDITSGNSISHTMYSWNNIPF